MRHVYLEKGATIKYPVVIYVHIFRPQTPKLQINSWQLTDF